MPGWKKSVNINLGEQKYDDMIPPFHPSQSRHMLLCQNICTLAPMYHARSLWLRIRIKNNRIISYSRVLLLG